MNIKLSSNEERRRSDSQSMQAISIRAGDVSHMVKSAEHASVSTECIRQWMMTILKKHNADYC